MKLKDNKKDISYHKASDMIYWKEKNVRYSKMNIWNKPLLNIHRLLTSNYLIGNIYHEINRE